MAKYDVVVIGTGAAASTAAMRCCKAGKQVAVVDSRPFGGTCALRGCDPKKVLVGAAEIVESVTRMKNKGIIYEGKCETESDAPVKIKWNDLMKFKRTFTEPVPKNREDSFDTAGIITFHGIAQFVSSHSIKLIGNNHGNDIYRDHDIANDKNKFYNHKEDNHR